MSKSCIDVLFVIDSTGSMRNAIQAAHDKVEDLSADLKMTHRKTDFKFGCICYRDKVADPKDENEVFDFDDEIENLAIFLEKVEAKGGGGDGPEDWVSAINDAFKLDWRDGKKLIVWLADYPAHGIRFAGRDKFPKEEEKLVALCQKLAKDGFYFTGIPLKVHAEKTFRQMKQIFEENSGKRFTIEEFTRESTPIDISSTFTKSTKKSVKTALSDDD